MVNRNPNKSVLLASLIETAVSTAHPDRLSRKVEGPEDYRLPFNRFDGQASLGESPANIDWSPALKSAYKDGYDPLLWIGRGAFSEVWRCVDRSFGREVAIKVPFHDQGKDSGVVVAALQSEAELLGRLHHPGIVHAVRRSGEGRNAYLALDFVDGENLIEHSQLLKLDARACLRLFEKSLDAAAYLHSKGIVHGDLKPDHILVRENDQPVIIDFGLSSYDSSMSLRLYDTNRVGGSGRFRAPEIANGSAVSTEPEQDVYSLGVILEELLEGAGDGPIDDQILKIIEKATAENSEERWPDASAMLDAIHSYKSDIQVVATPPRELAPAPQQAAWLKAKHWAVALVAVVALLIAGILIVSPEPDAPFADEAGNREASPSRPAVQASIFDLALQDYYKGNHEKAQERLEQLPLPELGGSTAWELRHLEAMSEGRGQLHPFGMLPFAKTHASCSDYDPTTETVVYVRRGQKNFELWTKSINGKARHFANSIESVRAVATSRGAERVASVDIMGTVKVWKLADNGVVVNESHELPRKVDDRALWFSADGNSLFVYSPRNRKVECWSVETPLPTKPKFVIDECDHAYRLPSGEGLFMTATAGEHSANGLTKLKVINPKGEVIRQIELADGDVPSSADSGPGQNATICLGMSNGFVRIHDTGKGGWQEPCDLGHYKPVPAIVYSTVENRAYAAFGRIHVVSSDGRLIMRLGDRNGRQQLVTRLDFDNNTSTLHCLSIREFWRCIAN